MCVRTRPHRAGELARAANVSFSRMSGHLKVLRQTGLVIEQRDELDSRARVYRLHPPALGRLKAWLNETDALWARQLSAFRAHVRKARR